MILTHHHPTHGPCVIEYDHHEGYPASFTGDGREEHVSVYSVVCEGRELVDDPGVYAWAEGKAWERVPIRKER